MNLTDAEKAGPPPQPLAWRVAACVLLLTVLRLGFAPWTELLPEEAYYWMYWQHPAAGYFDHPPMVAWSIGLGTALFGDTEFGVRCVTILLSAASAGLVFLLGRAWFGIRAALWASIAYALLPVFAAAGFIVTPDQTLLFFWLLALLGFTRGIESGKWRWWLLGGAAFGGALLSKYYAIMLGPSLLLFLAASPQRRRWLLRPQPWAALLVALAIFSPVIGWNAAHHWDSFLFQAGRTGGGTPHPARWVATFWAVQAAILTPLVLAWLGIALVHGWKKARQSEDAWTFALAFSLPLFLVFVAASFKTEVHVNWTAPAFLSLLPAAAALALERWSGRGRAWNIAAWATVVLCVAALLMGLSTLAWGLPRIYEPAGGWRALAAEVDAARKALHVETDLEPFVVGADKYDLAVEMAFYGREPTAVVNDFALGRGGLSFRYWFDPAKWAGHPAVVLLEEANASQLRKLRKRFTTVGEPRRVTTRGPGWHERTVDLVPCAGYKPASR